MKRKHDWFKLLMGLASVSMLVWLPSAAVHFLFRFLTERYYIYLKWPLTAIDLATLALWVMVLAFCIIRLRDVYYVLNGRLQVVMALAWHMMLFFISGTIFYNVLLAIPMGFYAARRCKALKLKDKPVMLQEVHHLAKVNLWSMAAAGVLFITSQVLTPGLAVSVAYTLGLDNIYIAAFIAIIGMAVANGGAIILFRTLYLNCAARGLGLS